MATGQRFSWLLACRGRLAFAQEMGSGLCMAGVHSGKRC